MFRMPTMEIIRGAIEKEEESLKAYLEAILRAEDPASRAMLQEMAEEERKQIIRLKELDTGGVPEVCLLERENLRISEFLNSKDLTGFSTFQDVLIFSMKREEAAVHAYAIMAHLMSDPGARRVFELLVHEEMCHKHKIESLYDDLIYKEN